MYLESSVVPTLTASEECIFLTSDVSIPQHFKVKTVFRIGKKKWSKHSVNST
jgi:hypothetical protein